jgi:hypothetical protein
MVLQYCIEKEMFLFFEPPNTSAFLQALDQLNQQVHIRYRKELLSLKHRLAAKYTAEGKRCDVGSVAIGTREFLQVLAKCWFEWSTPLERRTAWRKVGITEDGINPALIDRRKFTDYTKPEFPMAVPEFEEETAECPLEMVLPTKPDGSVDYEAAFKAQQANAQRMWEAPIKVSDYWSRAPDERPPVPRKKKGRVVAERDDKDTGGCISMSGILVKLRADNVLRESEELQKKRKKEQRQQKKTAENDAAAKLLADWERCNPRCVCGGDAPCEVSRLLHCRTCGDIKQHACKKRRCLAVPVYGTSVPRAARTQRDTQPTASQTLDVEQVVEAVV